MNLSSASILESTVNRLRERIIDARARRTSIGEQNTKMALINPLLTALGWDLENLDEISLEYRRKPQDNPVDFALFLFRTPCLFVEAKGLGADLADRRWISQTLGYATVVGVEWCVLTNGDEYRLYNAHAPVDVEDKLFRTIHLSDATSATYTLETLRLLSKDKMGEKQLDVLWNAHFVDRQVKQAVDNLILNQDPGLVRLLRKHTEKLTGGDIRSSLKRARISVDFPTVSVLEKSSQLTPTQKPARKLTSIRRVTTRKKPVPVPVSITDLIDKGFISTPLEIETSYLDQRLTAVVQSDGSILYNGKTYTSLSVSASMARVDVKGPPMDGRPFYQTNGWRFWKYRIPQTGKLDVMDVLRTRYLSQR